VSGASPEAKARAVLRERQIFELRAARVPMGEIANQLGISISRCSHIYKRALQRSPHPSVDAMRVEDNALIDRLIRALFPKAVGRPATAEGPAVPPDEAAVREIRLLLQRRARLNGMDAPLRITAEVHVVTEDAVDAELARLAAEVAAVQSSAATSVDA